MIVAFVLYFLYKYNNKKLRKLNVKKKIDLSYVFSVILGLMQIGIIFINYFGFKSSFFSIFAYTGLSFCFIFFSWKSFIVYIFYILGHLLVGIGAPSYLSNIKIINIFIEPIVLFLIIFLFTFFKKTKKFLWLYILLGYVINFLWHFAFYNINTDILPIFINILFSYIMFIFNYLIFLFLQGFIRNIIKINNLTIYRFKNVYNIKSASNIFSDWLKKNRKLIHINMFLTTTSTLAQNPESNLKLSNFVQTNKLNLPHFFYWNELNALSLVIDITDDEKLTHDLNDFYNNSDIIKMIKSSTELIFDIHEYTMTINLVLNNFNVKLQNLDLLGAIYYFKYSNYNYLWIPNLIEIYNHDKNAYGLYFKKIEFETGDYLLKWKKVNFLDNTFMLQYYLENKLSEYNHIDQLPLNLLAKRFLIKKALVNRIDLLTDEYKNLSTANYILDIPFDLLSDSDFIPNKFTYQIQRDIKINKLFLRINIENPNPIAIQNLISLSSNNFNFIIENVDKDTFVDCLSITPIFIRLKNDNEYILFNEVKKILINKFRHKF